MTTDNDKIKLGGQFAFPGASRRSTNRLRCLATRRPWRVRAAKGSGHGDWPCCVRQWRAASTTSIPATTTAPMSRTRSIREALHPYRDDLTIVTKVGARAR